MESNEVKNPFSLERVAEVHLSQAPLVRVVAQVRFPKIVSIEKSDFIAGFQEDIRGDFPKFKEEFQQVVTFDGKSGVTERKETPFWRFFDNEEVCRVTLTPDFLTLETTNYKDRTDFFKKFHLLISVLKNKIKPSSCTRVGLRYVDRVEGEKLSRIDSLVREEVLGIYASSELRSFLKGSMRNSIFEISKDVKLSSRWGSLPPGQTYDPGTVNPINEDSWILDIDVFNEASQEFDVELIKKNLDDLSVYAYNFFRWAVKEEFLTAYGANPNE